jgi:UDP-2,3-diacylglucosamine pyrophosphatase LpxH
MGERTLILSDWHNGSVACRESDLLRAVHTIKWDRLILAGDTTDTDSSLTACGRRLFDRLHQWSSSRSIVVLPGNHDPSIGVLCAAVGLRCEDAYTWTELGRRFLVTHGHQDPYTKKPWDRFLGGYGWPTKLGNQLEADAAFWGGRPGRWLAVKGHHQRKRICNVSEEVQDAALNLAAAEQVDVVICGHTHYPKWIKQNIAHAGYLNVGAWCEEVATYGAIENGIVTLEEFK